MVPVSGELSCDGTVYIQHASQFCEKTDKTAVSKAYGKGVGKLLFGRFGKARGESFFILNILFILSNKCVLFPTWD